MSKAIDYFKQITKIPRPSKKEGKITDFLIAWAIGKNLKYKIDKIGNLIIYAPGKNSKSSVILQAHMDMVCVKTPDSTHDFENDPLDLYEENGYLKARNTSLGADDGVGLALAMSATDFVDRPPLELVFTVDEEAGMNGVLDLDFSLLSAKNVINLDNESDDEICISSAGGTGIILEKNLKFISSNNKKYSLEIFGMKGGHSGVEIHKNHGNVIEIFLKFVSSNNLINEIFSINSGTASNVIPSQIEVILSSSNINELKNKLKEFLEEIKKIHDCPDLDFKIEKINCDLKAISDGVKILSEIGIIKVGVYKMSKKIPSLTETSMNLGIIKIKNGKINIVYLARSSINDDLKNLVDSTKKYFGDLSYKIELDRGYPGWQNNPDSNLVKVAKEEMAKVIGKSPKIIALHAGLECGALVGGLGKGVHAIAIGPNMYDVHSINEKVEIKSIERIEKALEGILKKF